MIVLTGILASGLVAALLLLFRPYLWNKKRSLGSQRALNISIYKEELEKLETERDKKRLSEPQFAAEQHELQQRLLLETDNQDLPLNLRSPKITVLLLVIFIPLLSGAIYYALGSPVQGVDPKAYEKVIQRDVEQMVAGLAAKLEKDPSDLKGWAMLARSYKVMHRPKEAELAYEKSGSYVQGDAQLLADYADVVATNANGSFAGKPLQLLTQALALNPDHPMALWLSGTASFNVGDYTIALRTWEHLATLLEAESEDAKLIQGAINDARVKLGR